MKEGTQRATKGSVEEGVGGPALQFLVFSPLSLSPSPLCGSLWWLWLFLYASAS